jgi:2-polyprenyl-3-methyl-5-hydroxy-6-metoxy-1,4-benzoquinol methylase
VSDVILPSAATESCLYTYQSRQHHFGRYHHTTAMAQPELPPGTEASWFEENPTKDHIPTATQRLLETYSGIPSDEVFDHAVKLRDEAWKVHPYPCIGQFRFLEPSFTELPNEYHEAVERLCNGQKLLDMACCVGQTIRQLVDGGAPSENIYGTDLQPDFIELGYTLFKDRNKLQSKFVVADIFDSNSALADLKDQIDMVYAGSFFHLWGYEKQYEVSKAVVALLRPQPGSMIFGRQVGAIEANERTGATGIMYRHNVESFKKMWKNMGDDMGIKFSVEAKLAPLGRDHVRFHSEDTKRLWFVIRRE